ncbi:hypothetical protein BpHYR1_005694 [Brachionus plicatilis]|uniref:Uncharacterized protein n=1 Tax=Brachionus plicatilis TaxID=10195 RepID=A0A3M7PXS2_BRAPC|nr:hypothetical protein BpHYR1_005694 [Brachionus plicatilis]
MFVMKDGSCLICSALPLAHPPWDQMLVLSLTIISRVKKGLGYDTNPDLDLFKYSLTIKKFNGT